VNIVRAATDLARGTALSDEMLLASTVPDDFVPAGAVRDAGAVVGRVLTADIEAGEILTRSRLAATAVGPVAALVPQGLRALVVPSGAPAGTIRAGDRIEVYATYGGGRPHTELVATGLEVLRVLTGGTSSGSGGTSPGDPGVALVLVADADTAARLAYARAFGQLQVAILGPAPTPAA
jgi:Flp pilus assembly protein CpaB